MSDLSGFPELATAESVRELKAKLLKIQQEMDAMWEPVRNLEEKLLAPSEQKAKYSSYAIGRHDFDIDPDALIEFGRVSTLK